MATEPKLEEYLASLDKALNRISVSERAEIVTEIKSHVLDAREKDSSQSLGSILSALGDPETVANRFLLERGLKPGKPAKSPMIKWLTIGFLGTVGLCFLMFIFLLIKFSPLISIEKEHVTFLGGAIDIDGDAGEVKVGGAKIGDFTFHGGQGSYEFSGTKKLADTVKAVNIPFSNGKLDVVSGPDLAWKCKVSGPANSARIAEIEKEISFDFSQSDGIKCDIQVPPGKKINITGNNGKLDVEKPQGDLSISLNNGIVRIAPDPERKYVFTNEVRAGKIDSFESSTAPDAIRVAVKLSNGKIERE
jgi:hypothetical protein